LAFDNLFDNLSLNKTDKRKDSYRIDHFTGLVYCPSFAPNLGIFRRPLKRDFILRSQANQKGQWEKNSKVVIFCRHRSSSDGLN